MKRNWLWTHHDNEHLIGTTVTDGPPMLVRGSAQGANRFAGLPASRGRTIAAGGRGVVLQLRRSRSWRLRRQSGHLPVNATKAHGVESCTRKQR